MDRSGSNAASQSWDVIIVGAGPAGLNAALMLGRCGRRTLVCDRGTPRNGPSRKMYGFLSRDGIRPADFAEAARRDLRQYPTVVLKSAQVNAIDKQPDGGFLISFEQGVPQHCRKLLIATGLFDDLPKIDG